MWALLCDGSIVQQMSREEGEAAVRVSLPEGTTATVGVRDGMSVEEFLAAACARRSLNPLEHFVRVKKRRDMEDHNYFVPHRSDLIETYVRRAPFVLNVEHELYIALGTI